MEIVNLVIIEDFKERHPGSRKPIESWLNIVLFSHWKTPHDIKKVFPTASFIRQFVIFNIGGNKYRLLTKIAYEIETVRVLRMGTHKEYDEWKL